jgi:hypothetical protein
LTEPSQPRHVPHDELELIDGPVTRDGGDLRVLQGSDHGLLTSVMHSQVVPGSGQAHLTKGRVVGRSRDPPAC